MQVSGYLNLKDLPQIAVGLNIEGYRPILHLPENCKWYNIIQAIDEPLCGLNFDDVMMKKKENNYDYIEQAVGIDIDVFVNQIIKFVNNISKNHQNVLIHIHQYTGTTKLHEIIQQRTSITTILDQTNFFESPIDYSKEYPDIDALISISQCAGLGIKPGTWIIPNSFMHYNIKYNIINTNKFILNNNATLYFLDDHIVGNVLIADDLWNPNLSEGDILLFDALDQEVFEFVKESTQIFDSSHNWEHALCVARNATKIRNTKKSLYLALLHDVCDHKYPNSIPRSELSKFITLRLPEFKDIDQLIDHVSYSHQKLGIIIKDDDLDAVRDADRIEALGEIGIIRCQIITTIRGGKIPEDVIEHCYDKLLRLLPENFIITSLGRELALPKHNIIVKYVIENLPKTNLNKIPPTYIEKL